MKPVPGQQHIKSYYRFMLWLYPIGWALYPAAFCTLEELGKAMIHAASAGYSKRILEVKDIVRLAES